MQGSKALNFHGQAGLTHLRGFGAKMLISLDVQHCFLNARQRCRLTGMQVTIKSQVRDPDAAHDARLAIVRHTAELTVPSQEYPSATIQLAVVGEVSVAAAKFKYCQRFGLNPSSCLLYLRGAALDDQPLAKVIALR